MATTSAKISLMIEINNTFLSGKFLNTSDPSICNSLKPPKSTVRQHARILINHTFINNIYVRKDFA